MSGREWLEALFISIDAKETAHFCQFLSVDCLFRFGNQAPVQGVEAIRGYVGAFFESIASLRHELSEVWHVTDGAVCHGMVHYTRHDGSRLSVPFCNVFRSQGGKIHEYLVFADTSALYAN